MFFVALQGKLFLFQFSLAGGYYDAGDNVVFGFPMAFSMTVLAWSAVEYGDQIQRAGQMKYLQQTLRWGLDFMIKCHSSDYTYWVQVNRFEHVNFD